MAKLGPPSVSTVDPRGYCSIHMRQWILERRPKTDKLIFFFVFRAC